MASTVALLGINFYIYRRYEIFKIGSYQTCVIRISYWKTHYDDGQSEYVGVCRVQLSVYGGYGSTLGSSRFNAKPSPDATNCNINRESEEWNERQIVSECVWLGSMCMNVSVGRETLFTVIFSTDVFVILLFWLIMWFFHLHWGSLGSAERTGEESRKERWNRTFLSCETPTTKGLLLKFFVSSSSSWHCPKLYKNALYRAKYVHFQKKHWEFIPELPPSLFSSSTLMSHSILSISLPPLAWVWGWTEFLEAFTNHEQFKGRRKGMENQSAQEKERNMSAREERKWCLKDFELHLIHSVHLILCRVVLCAASLEKLRTIATHDCRAQPAAASCYCLWAWLSLCISNVHLKAQWKQIEWICCGQRNVCVCVCVWMTDYTERERERERERRNGDFRGGEVMLTLSCCQMQGVESEEGVMKKKRERERFGAHCLL